VAALQKQQNVMELTNSLKFDEQLRKIGQAIEGVPKEMTFAAIMADVKGTQERIRDLEGAVASANSAVRDQEGYIRALERANRDISAAIQSTQDQLQGAEAKQKAVTAALTTAYTWYLNDKQALEDMGTTATTQAALVDKACTDLLTVTTQYAQDQSAAAVAAINAALDAYRVAQAEMAKGLGVGASVPVPVLPSLPAQSLGNQASGGSYIVGGAGGVDSQLIMARATPGERVTFTPPGAGGGVDYDRLAAALSSQPIIVQLDGQTVAQVVRRQLRETGRLNAGLAW